MKTKFCPQCESSNVEMVSGGIMGAWKCRDCGFQGSVFPEKDREENEDEK